MHIYWVESQYHDEDWFVAAKNPSQAIEFFADDLGYEPIEDDISAIEVDSIDIRLNIDVPCYLSNQQIIDCGGELVNYHDKDLLKHVSKEVLEMLDSETRVVKFDNRIFVEGNLMRVMLQTQAILKNDEIGR